MAEFITQKQSKTKEQNCFHVVIRIFRNQLRENIVLVLTILGVVIGVILGFVLRSTTNFKPPTKKYFGVPGDLFLRSLKFLILPCISTSLITGIGGIGSEKTGKVAIRAFIFYLISTILAVIVGLTLVTTIQPGTLGKGALRSVPLNAYEYRRINPIDNFIYILKYLLTDYKIKIRFLN